MHILSFAYAALWFGPVLPFTTATMFALGDEGKGRLNSGDEADSERAGVIPALAMRSLIVRDSNLTLQSPFF